MAFFNPSTTRSVGRRAAGQSAFAPRLTSRPQKSRDYGSRSTPDGSAPRPGGPPGSSDAEVKAAYRKAALRWHPDRHAGSDPATAADAAERFRRASEAFARLSGGGDARGGRGSGAGASGRRPWSSHAAGSGAGSGYGYYNGSDDPFGFRTAESARTGDHMRRIHRNIRVLYASLACLGALIYLAPEPPSPVEQAKARRRREMRARGRGEQPALHFVERVNPTLALGSPLYSSDAGKIRAVEDDDFARERRA